MVLSGGTAMKKILSLAAATVLTAALFISSAGAAATAYTVVSGDSLWKIAVKYEVGVSELIAANPNLIYPGQVLNINQVDKSVTAYEHEVVRLVNQIRQQNALNPLTENWQLSRVARYKSQDMVNKGYFSHTSPTYGSPSQMIKAFGLTFRTAGENIAYGYSTPQDVVNGWMNSIGHRANILNAAYTQIGVGYVANGNYWTQMFVG